MAGLDDFDLLIADSSVLFRFFEAGPDCTRKLMEYCGDRLYIVHDVAVEIDRYASDETMKDGIAVFAELLRNDPLDLPIEITEKVADILRLGKSHLPPSDEDRGEVATVLYAKWAWDNEEWEFLVLIADNFGSDLAESREIAVINTTDTVVELVRLRALTPADGEVLWRSMFGEAADIGSYYEKLKKACPEVL